MSTRYFAGGWLVAPRVVGTEPMAGTPSIFSTSSEVLTSPDHISIATTVTVAANRPAKTPSAMSSFLLGEEGFSGVWAGETIWASDCSEPSWTEVCWKRSRRDL